MNSGHYFVIGIGLVLGSCAEFTLLLGEILSGRLESYSETRGPRAWRSADDFEEMDWREFFRFFQKEGNMQRRNFSIPKLYYIISQMWRSQPCDGDTEASKNLI
jgi:hypothetical protein